MGSLILCHRKKAKQPYEITRIRRKIFTIEELCYYLCNNLYLVDYTIMNNQLCDWISEELELDDLAEELRESLQHYGSVEKFVLSILTASSIYTAGEISRIQNVLERLKNQKDIERKKFKADNLLQSGETEAAVLVYQEIIHGEKDETVDGKFYGKVYGCLGACYGRMFLYKEAADMYEAAFLICEEESMLKAYLYACLRFMPEDEYRKMVEKSNIYTAMNAALKKEMQKTREEVKGEYTEEIMEEWKAAYRSFRR